MPRPAAGDESEPLAGPGQPAAASITVTLLQAQNLYDAEKAGEPGPYVEVELRMAGFERTVRGREHGDKGGSPDFEREVLALPCGDELTMGDMLVFTVMDRDHVAQDDFVGGASLSLTAAALDNPGDIHLDLPLYRTGGLHGALHIELSMPPSLCSSAAARWSLPSLHGVQMLVHRTAGAVASYAEGEGGESFSTYEVMIPRSKVEEVFADRHQRNHDKEHQEIFDKSVRGSAMRSVTSVGHWALYREGNADPPTYIHDGAQFLDQFAGGVRLSKRRVYIYALVCHDDKVGFFFSETSAKKAKDVLSKHALRAAARPSVRCSGTFRICEKALRRPAKLKIRDPNPCPEPCERGADGIFGKLFGCCSSSSRSSCSRAEVLRPSWPDMEVEVGKSPSCAWERVLVLDNDSGSDRPEFEAVELTARLLTETFPGLEVYTLNVTEDQPKHILEWIGPVESKEHSAEQDLVYDGQWIWAPSKMEEQPRAFDLGTIQSG